MNIQDILKGTNNNESAVTSGTLTKLLQNGVPVEEDDADFMIQPREKGETQLLFERNNIDVDEDGQYITPQQEVKDGRRMLTIHEIMDDDDFIPELRQCNELLLKFLDKEQFMKIIQLVVQEPQFNDTPSRCFKLPFVATQALCIDIEHVTKMLFEDENYQVLNTLFAFIQVPEENQLNSTLCGYFNKILSFWFQKKSGEMLTYIYNNEACINNIVEHIYLNSSIIDIVIRICCLQNLNEEQAQMLNEIRSEILQSIINKLEHYQDDFYMTEQIFCILNGLLKKCYVMINPTTFFEEMLSFFTLKPILDYTFQPEFGQHTSIGAAFLQLMLYNLFICEPNDAIQDTLEANFGFQVTQIAGIDVEQKDEEEKKEDEDGIIARPGESEEDDNEDKDQKSGGEFSVMQQAELQKQALLKGKKRIFESGTLDEIIRTLLAQEIPNLENLLTNQVLPTNIKVKLYELLQCLIQVGEKNILEKIEDSKILNQIIIDYDRYETNTNILILLNSTVKSILSVNSPTFVDKILFDLKLLEQFANKLSSEENKVSRAVKKDIYPFIHNLTEFILEICNSNQELEKKLSRQTYWNTLKDQLIISTRIFDVQWGESTDTPVPIDNTSSDIVVKHLSENPGQDKFSIMAQKGAASTTKKIVEKSVASRKTLAKFDDVIN